MKKTFIALTAMLGLGIISCQKEPIAPQVVATVSGNGYFWSVVTPKDTTKGSFFLGYCFGNWIEETPPQKNVDNKGTKAVYFVNCPPLYNDEQIKAYLLREGYVPAGAGYLEGYVEQWGDKIPRGVMLSTIGSTNLKDKGGNPILQIIFQTSPQPGSGCWFSFTVQTGNNWNNGQVEVFYACLKK